MGLDRKIESMTHSLNLRMCGAPQKVWGTRPANSRDAAAAWPSFLAFRFQGPGFWAWPCPRARHAKASGSESFLQNRLFRRRFSLPDRCLHFERPLRGATDGLFVGNPYFSSSGRTGREDPQPDTNPSQMWLAVKSVSVSNCEGKQKARKLPLRGVWGVNPTVNPS